MARRMFVLLTLLFAVKNSSAQTDSVAKAAHLLRIEQSLMDAIATGDSNLWNRYLDPDYYTITEDGTGYFKKEFLATFSPLPKDFSGHILLTKPVFVFHDKSAVLHFVADEYETVYGQKLHTTYGMVDTWYQTDTSWKMIGSQVFEIPQLPPSIRVSPKILEGYTGRFHMDNYDSCTISLKNDTLFMQRKTRPPFALFAETENVFFRTADTRGRKIFVRNERGEMLMLERRNGQDLVWKRNP